MLIAELMQFRRSPARWRQNFFNLVDVLVLVLLLISTALRFILIDERGVLSTRIPALDFADWLNQHYSGHAGELRPSWFKNEYPATLSYKSQCPWTIEIELLRSLLGLVIFALSYRLLEFMAFTYDIGVLMARALARLPPQANPYPTPPPTHFPLLSTTVRCCHERQALAPSPMPTRPAGLRGAHAVRHVQLVAAHAIGHARSGARL